MSFPDGVQTVTITAGAAGYRTLDGEPYQGTIRLTPSVARVVSEEYGVIALGPVNATIGASGQFEEDPEVLAIDADGFEPSGWTYRVDEEFTNAPGRAYNISLPAAVPSVALPSLTPVEQSDGTTVWQPSGTPSDTVTAETSYGLSSSAGSSVAYARGDHTHGTPALPPTGTTAGTYAAGNDSRLSDARTPTAHAASHGSAGSDPVTVTQSQVTGLDAALSGKLPLTGGTVAGGLVIDKFGAPGGYPLGQSGSVNSLSLPSSYAGGDDNGSGTDTTGRINLYSYQRANVGSFGENIRNFAMRSDAKTMQAFYIPVDSSDKGGYDPVTRDPKASGVSWHPVVWQGAHYEANDHASIHGHWELEIADLNGALQGRLEIPFIDQPTDGAKALDQATIGVAYTNIRTNLADLSVRAQNMSAGPYSGQNTCLRVGGNNTVNKDLALSISSDMGTTGRRWIVRANNTTEGGSNAGTDFQIRRYDDTGTFLDAPIHIERSTGRIGVGGVTAPTAGLHVQRATGQVVYLDAQATTQSAILVNGVDTTVKALQAQVAGDTQKRFQVLTDGAHSWGPGGSTAPDTTLYRSAAGTLKTDGALQVAGTLTPTSFTMVGTSLLNVTGSATTTDKIGALVTGDTFDRFRLRADGQQAWGDGTQARDTFLRRLGPGQLGTDGTFAVGGTPLWTPSRQGLKGWSFDPVVISSSAAAAVAGTFYLSLIELTDAATLTTLYWDVATVASGVTAGQNFVCLVNPSGGIVGSVGVDADIVSTGLKATTISVPYTAGQWRAGFLFNATTPPALARCGAVTGSVNAVNANITGAALRGAVNGTGLTALPGSVTLSSNGSGSFHWAAVK